MFSSCCSRIVCQSLHPKSTVVVVVGIALVSTASSSSTIGPTSQLMNDCRISFQFSSNLIRCRCRRRSAPPSTSLFFSKRPIISTPGRISVSSGLVPITRVLCLYKDIYSEQWTVEILQQVPVLVTRMLAKISEFSSKEQQNYSEWISGNCKMDPTQLSPIRNEARTIPTAADLESSPGSSTDSSVISHIPYAYPGYSSSQAPYYNSSGGNGWIAAPSAI